MTKENNNSKYKRRTNIFLIFLICSALIWLISKLSETYTERTSFAMEFVNAPDSLLFAKASSETVNVRLSANGFQFLYFNIGKKKVQIDLSQVRRRGDKYYVARENYQGQIDRQLPRNMTLLDLDSDTLYVEFEKIFSKTVRVVPNLNLELASNHLLEGELEIDPPTIDINGPSNEIYQVEEVYTVSQSLTDLSEDFNVTVELARWADLSNTTYSENSVRVAGKVYRFSEQLIDIPVKVVNLPEGVEVRTFPNTISALCKARIDLLKTLRPQDFELVADFEKAKEGKQELEVNLLNMPDGVYDAKLNENKVEFILIRR